MTEAVVLDLLREAFWLTLVLVAVMILPSLLVGLLVALFQAATQINEQTLSFLPRLLTILLTLIVAGPWLVGQLLAFSQNLIASIPHIIGQSFSVLHFTDAQITDWVASLLLPFFRVGALLLSMPIIGGHLLPMRIRLYLAVLFSAVLLPHLPPSPALFGFNLQTLLLIVQELLNGLLLGLCLQLFFQMFLLAGQMLASQMGLAFASTVDPASGTSSVVLGQFLNILAMLLFLAAGGHLLLLALLAESFHGIPVGSGFLIERYPILFAQLGTMMGGALTLVLPQIIALLVINLSFGLMSRAAPQLNIFSIGFALSLLVGLLLLWISLAGFAASFESLAYETFATLRTLTKAH